MHNFRRFAWATLAYNIGVIIWGAFVRATGSGAGCGEHWPLCNGEILPRAAEVETLIEFTHRITSGLALVAVLALVVWSRRLFPKGHAARRAAFVSLVFIVVEALLGAGLVLLRYVEQNASYGRAVYLSAHLTNTLILLGCLAWTAWAARTSTGPRWPALPRDVKWGLAAVIAAGITGAVAALGDTLFPATSFVAGVRAETAADAHALLRLRLVHPVVAVLSAGYLIFLALRWMRLHPEAHRPSRVLLALTIVQTVAGGVNVLLLAPVWMQMLHLFLATLVWLAVVMMGLEGGSGGVKPRES